MLPSIVYYLTNAFALYLSAAAGLGGYVKRDGVIAKEVLQAAAKAACAELAHDSAGEEEEGDDADDESKIA